MQIIKFDVISLMLNPFVLMFVTVGIGLLFGKIKFGKFSFGTSGALFVGLAIGWAVYGYASKIYATEDSLAKGFKAASQIMSINGGKVINSYFFSAALIIFVAAVGLLAAKDLGIVLKKYGAKFVVLGLLITLIGAGATYACTAFINSTNHYAVSGVYTGAMTSSPGLASALETAENQASFDVDNWKIKTENEKNEMVKVLTLNEKYQGVKASEIDEFTDEMKADYVKEATAQVGIGSAVGYPFGVIIVILAVNFLSVPLP